MSGFSNIVKNGWHPDKNADFKKQVTGIWKKDDSAYEARANHASRPLSSLRDPASFGPPPRHVALGGEPSAGGTAVSTHTTPSSHSSAHPSSQHAPATPARPSLPSRPRATSSATEEEEEPREPQPYRMDTTGLNTSHLPAPPTRRDGSGISRSPAPPPYSSGPTKRPTAAPPGLPPRLPPRSTPSPNPPAGASSASAQPPPPPRQPVHARVSPATTGNAGHTGNDTYINQDAVNRLGRAGISVPGLGIGGPASGGAHGGQAQPTALSAINSLAATSSASAAHEPAQTVNLAPPASQLGELQARFAKMGTAGGVAGGASRTPSRSPARLRANSGAHSSAAVSGSSTPALSSGAAASIAAGKKKPPPPPPAKKPGLAAVKPHPARPEDDDDAPPPIPMATRPQGW